MPFALVQLFIKGYALIRNGTTPKPKGGSTWRNGSINGITKDYETPKGYESPKEYDEATSLVLG